MIFLCDICKNIYFFKKREDAFDWLMTYKNTHISCDVVLWNSHWYATVLFGNNFFWDFNWDGSSAAPSKRSSFRFTKRQQDKNFTEWIMGWWATAQCGISGIGIPQFQKGLLIPTTIAWPTRSSPNSSLIHLQHPQESYKPCVLTVCGRVHIYSAG